MIDDADSLRALTLFDAALELPPDERAAWIDAQCAGDASLALEVRALLAAAERSTGILDVAPGFDALPELADAVRAALANSYEIERELGRGGMATVFLARERKHDRHVVIKVLDPAIAHLFGGDRFLREVRIAATLGHPHIVPLIDSGEADGLLYYVMPWMDGETLRARLLRGRPSLTEGIGILRDVAGALEFAHRAGVVHRDLKPENVLLTAGHAYLLDFGIAKLLDDSPAAMSITVPGFPIGTRRYMAPEQAFGAADVDARADVFAWGVLGVELFTAEPFAAGEARQVARTSLLSRPELPPELTALLLECLATAADRRPASMTVVGSRLDALARVSRTVAPQRLRRRTIAGGALVIGVAAIAAVTLGDEGGATTGIAEPIAATILRNETGDSTISIVGRYAGDWVTDGLQRMGAVRVVPWSEALLASEHATSTGKPLVATVREEVHAGTVVTGAFYRLRDSLHLQAQLTDARSGRLVSALAPIIVPATRPEDGVAQLRDRVLGAVAAARDERVSTVPGLTRNPPSFSAYQSFDRGLDHFMAQRYDEALAAFREASSRDTTFTTALLLGARAAWNGDRFAVAESLVTRVRASKRDMGEYNESSLRFLEALLQGDGPVARAAIQRAAALAPNSRAGYDLAASLLNGGYARAAREQLLRMDPARGEMRGWSSYWTQRAHAAYLLGNHQEEAEAAREMARRHPDRRVALVLAARALAAAGDTRALDSALSLWEPLPANVYWSQGAAMIVAGDELARRGRDADGQRYLERAVAWLTNRLVAFPTDRAHRYWLGSALYSLGRFAEARPYYEGLAREYPDRVQYRGLAAVSAARRGDRAAAERWLGRSAPRDTGEVLAFRARIAAVSGDVEGAIMLFTTAIDRGIDAYAWLPGSAFRDLAPLRQDVRGRALLVGR